MTDKKSKLRVLLIGSGRRIKNNYLPALKTLDDFFEIKGICSRTESNARAVATMWNIPSLSTVTSAKFDEIDVVAISIPTDQNASVLRQLLPHADRIKLVIDTPIAWNRKEFEETDPLLRQFSSVTVTEDYMNFPQFGLVRDVVRTGLIGNLKSITLSNTGYLYHGLALLRSFVGFQPVLRHSRFLLDSFSTIVRYQFREGLTGSVIGPYRRHTTGGFFIEGQNGIITEFRNDQQTISSVPVYYVSRQQKAGVSGFSIEGREYAEWRPVPRIDQMQLMPFEDRSNLNIERGCGLADVFMSLIDFRSINNAYTYKQALYDCFASRRALEGAQQLDPFDLIDHQEDVELVQVHKRVSLQPTFLKASTMSAAELTDEEKISVAAESEIMFTLKGDFGDHLQVEHITLNGQKVREGNWFLYRNHWHSAG